MHWGLCVLLGGRSVVEKGGGFAGAHASDGDDFSGARCGCGCDESSRRFPVVSVMRVHIRKKLRLLSGSLRVGVDVHSFSKRRSAQGCSKIKAATARLDLRRAAAASMQAESDEARRTRQRVRRIDRGASVVESKLNVISLPYLSVAQPPSRRSPSPAPRAAAACVPPQQGRPARGRPVQPASTPSPACPPSAHPQASRLAPAARSQSQPGRARAPQPPAEAAAPAAETR